MYVCACVRSTYVYKPEFTVRQFPSQYKCYLGAKSNRRFVCFGATFSRINETSASAPSVWDRIHTCRPHPTPSTHSDRTDRHGPQTCDRRNGVSSLRVRHVSRYVTRQISAEEKAIAATRTFDLVISRGMHASTGLRRQSRARLAAGTPRRVSPAA